MNNEQVEELLCQALETEMGGVTVYEHAVRCAQNDDLKKEWREYLEQTRNHEIAIQFVQQETREAGFVQVSMQDPFTVRTQGQGHPRRSCTA